MAEKQKQDDRVENEEEQPPAKRAKAKTKSGGKRPPKLPVIVLTGYLGAGKTTLLNYLLAEQKEKRLAVIENEIGEVSIDDALVEQKAEDMAEELVVLDNGCVCCTIRGDLVKTLHNITKKRKEGLVLDGVLIELTGAADPAPVVQTFMIDADMERSYYVDNVIALVDAKHAIQKLGDRSVKGTACAQIAFSSTVLLNKIDLVDAAQLEAIEKRINEINSTVNILRCEHARVEVAKLFNVRAFNLEKVLDEQYMDEEEFKTFYKPQMDGSISNVGVKCQGAMNLHAFQMFLSKYLDEEDTANDFLRVKGVLNIITSNRMFVIQGVHMIRNQSFTKLWKKGEPRENRVIFIGRGMEERRQELTEGLKACIAKPLRFKVGQEVLANVPIQKKQGTNLDAESKEHHGDSHAHDHADANKTDRKEEYRKAKIVKTWDDFHAYRIRVDDGREVHAPVDDDEYVKPMAAGTSDAEAAIPSVPEQSAAAEVPLATAATDKTDDGSE